MMNFTDQGRFTHGVFMLIFINKCIARLKFIQPKHRLLKLFCLLCRLRSLNFHAVFCITKVNCGT